MLIGDDEAVAARPMRRCLLRDARMPRVKAAGDQTERAKVCPDQPPGALVSGHPPASNRRGPMTPPGPPERPTLQPQDTWYCNPAPKTGRKRPKYIWSPGAHLSPQRRFPLPIEVQHEFPTGDGNGTDVDRFYPTQTNERPHVHHVPADAAAAVDGPAERGRPLFSFCARARGGRGIDPGRIPGAAWSLFEFLQADPPWGELGPDIAPAWMDWLRTTPEYRRKRGAYPKHFSPQALRDFFAWPPPKNATEKFRGPRRWPNTGGRAAGSYAGWASRWSSNAASAASTTACRRSSPSSTKSPRGGKPSSSRRRPRPHNAGRSSSPRH